MDLHEQKYVSTEGTVISHLCPKCKILRFRHLSEVSSIPDTKPTFHLYDQHGEPFRPNWAENTDLGVPYFLPIHNTFQELEQSARDGCHFCLQMLFSFSEKDLAKFKLLERRDVGRKVWLEYRESKSRQPGFQLLLEKSLYLSYDQTYRILKILTPG
jgi:hypothetical protein